MLTRSASVSGSKRSRSASSASTQSSTVLLGGSVHVAHAHCSGSSCGFADSSVSETSSPPSLQIDWRRTKKTDGTLYFRLACSLHLQRQAGGYWLVAWGNPCAQPVGPGPATALAPGESYAGAENYGLSDFMREYVPSGVYRLHISDVSTEVYTDRRGEPIALKLRVSPSFDFTFPD